MSNLTASLRTQAMNATLGHAQAIASSGVNGLDDAANMPLIAGPARLAMTRRTPAITPSVH